MGNKYIVGDLYVNDSKVVTEDTLPEGFSGSYNDLADKPNIPTVPTKVSAFENDSKYVTEDILNGQYSEGLSYTLKDNGEYAVSGIGTCTDTNIVIPSVIDGHRITSIGERAFYSCDALTSVTIGDSVTSIGVWAFYGCDALTSVTIGDSVTSIGKGAFSVCHKLTNVSLGNSVISIGERAFEHCTSLTSITILNSVISISDSAFGYCTKLTLYCEAESQPEGWTTTWNPSECSVVWGAALDFAMVNEKIANNNEATLAAAKEYAANNAAVVLAEAQAYTDDAVANVSVELDTTLTQSNKAADAKAVGDAIKNVSYNDLTDKPFCEVIKNDKLKVDWDTFVPEVVETTMQGFVKVSDIVPTLEDFTNGAIIDDGSYATEISQDEIVSSYNQFGCLYRSFNMAVIPSDNFSLHDPWDNFTLIFPERGIYFDNWGRPTTFTINGFNGFPNTTEVKQLDRKYFPEPTIVIKDNNDLLKLFDGTYKFENTITVDDHYGDVRIMYPAYHNPNGDEYSNNFYTYSTLPYLSDGKLCVYQHVHTGGGTNMGQMEENTFYLNTQ